MPQPDPIFTAIAAVRAEHAAHEILTREHDDEAASQCMAQVVIALDRTTPETLADMFAVIDFTRELYGEDPGYPWFDVVEKLERGLRRLARS
jgi:hypothetical protein